MRDLRQKKVHLDILRVIAILGVMFTHSGTYGVYRFLETDNRFNFWFGLVLATLTQLCVPLFFMISGALLLRKKETLAYVCKHRILRMFLVIVVLAFILFLNHYFSFLLHCFFEIHTINIHYTSSWLRCLAQQTFEI